MTKNQRTKLAKKLFGDLNRFISESTYSVDEMLHVPDDANHSFNDVLKILSSVVSMGTVDAHQDIPEGY